MSNNSNNFGNDLGNQLKKAIEDAVGKGDFSQLKDIGTSASKAAKEFGESFSQTIETRKNGDAKMAKSQPYEPEVVNNKSGQNSQQPMWAGSSYGRRKNSKKRKNPYSIAPAIFSAFGCFVFAIALLVFMITYLAIVPSPLVLGSGIFSAIGVGISAICLKNSLGSRSFGARINTYYDLLEKEEMLTIEELAFRTGSTAATVRKDIKKGIAKDLMPGIRVDNTGEKLLYGEKAYEKFLQEETEREKTLREERERLERLNNPQTADLEKFKIDNRETLLKIRTAQNEIKSPEMQRKIILLEETAEDIFTYVEKHPEKMPDIRKLVSYYLPTLLKLLDEYKKYEQVDIKNSEVEKAKQDISKTLDTANVAFITLLESLYKEDTLDVKTDIKVFNSMLKQEGLTGKEFELDGE